jgi:triosephosphate isomerase
MKKLIVANWKMTPQTLHEAERLFYDIQKSVPGLKNTDIVICPPFIYLELLSRILKAKSYKLKVKLGAQDFFWEKKGSYTGEISITMLKNLGAKYVVVGHSERRQNLGETDEMINKKIKLALKNNLKVIFCVGEKERDEAGDYLKFIKKEVIQGLDKISRKDLKNLIIAYEPIWAISSTRSARSDNPEEFLQISIYIRRVLFFKFGRKVAHQIPILYGGSVDASNARDFLEKGRADGLLIGRASWKAKTFVDLLKSI